MAYLFLYEPLFEQILLTIKCQKFNLSVTYNNSQVVQNAQLKHFEKVACLYLLAWLRRATPGLAPCRWSRSWSRCRNWNIFCNNSALSSSCWVLKSFKGHFKSKKDMMSILASFKSSKSMYLLLICWTI